MTLSDSDVSNILEECKASCARIGISSSGSSQYFQTVSGILQDLQDHFPEETEIRYRIRRRLGQLELVLLVKGEKMDPLTEGSRSQGLTPGRQFRLLENIEAAHVMGVLHPDSSHGDPGTA